MPITRCQKHANKFFLGLVLSKAVSDTSDSDREDSMFSNDFGRWIPDPFYDSDFDSELNRDFYRFEKRNSGRYTLEPKENENIGYYKRAMRPLMSQLFI